MDINLTWMNITPTNNISNSLYSFSRDVEGLRYKCEINALGMMDQVNRLPTIAYWFLFGALLLLTVYLFYINISKNSWVQNHLQKDFIILPYLLLVIAIVIYSLVTFNIPAVVMMKYIQYIVYGIAGIIFIKLSWYWLRKWWYN